MKYKKGDKIRIVDGGNIKGGSCLADGEIYTVSYVSQENLTLARRPTDWITKVIDATEFQYIEKAEEFEKGELIEVKNCFGEWIQRKYITTIDHRYKYVVESEVEGISGFREARKIQKKIELTLSEIADKFDIPRDQLRIKD